MPDGSFDIPAVALLVAILLAGFWLLVHLFWFFKRCFPSVAICAAVHRNLPGWTRQSLSLFTEVPRDLTVGGFLASLIWPAIIGINLLFLAQVLEILVSAGRRVTIGGFGSYSALALAMATLYSLTQTMFGVAFTENKAHWWRWLILLLLAVSILSEGGLAVYRACVITHGQTPVGQTVGDEMMTRYGMALAGFLGIIVPISHTMAGHVAFPHFLVPMIRYSLNVAGGMGLLLWSGFTWLYFGFHSVIPVVLPVWAQSILGRARDLRRNARVLDGEVKYLLDCRGKLANLRATLPRMTIGDIESTIQALSVTRKQKVESWEALAAQFRASASLVRQLAELDNLTQELGKAGIRIRSESEEIVRQITSIEKGLDALDRLPRTEARIQRELESINKGLPDVKVLERNLHHAAEVLQVERDDVLDIWNDRPRANRVIVNVQKFCKCNAEAASGCEPDEARFAVAEFNACARVISDEVSPALLTTANDLKRTTGHLDELEKLLDPQNATGSQAVDESRLNRAEDDLKAIEDVMEYGNHCNRELRKVRRMLEIRRRQILRRPAWWYWLKGLFNSQARAEGME